MVDIETLDTVLAEQTDMTELVGDDGREHSRLPGLAEVQLDHGVTIGLVVPADRPVPGVTARSGVRRRRPRQIRAHRDGVRLILGAPAPRWLRLLRFQEPGGFLGGPCEGDHGGVTPVDVYPYRLILRTSVCVSGRTGPRRQADAAGCRPPGR